MIAACNASISGDVTFGNGFPLSGAFSLLKVFFNLLILLRSRCPCDKTLICLVAFSPITVSARLTFTFLVVLSSSNSTFLVKVSWFFKVLKASPDCWTILGGLECSFLVASALRSPSLLVALVVRLKAFRNWPPFWDNNPPASWIIFPVLSLARKISVVSLEPLDATIALEAASSCS